MQKIITVCDCCNAEDEYGVRVAICTRAIRDIVSNAKAFEYIHVDLCRECIKIKMKYLTESIIDMNHPLAAFNIRSFLGINPQVNS